MGSARNVLEPFKPKGEPNAGGAVVRRRRRVMAAQEPRPRREARWGSYLPRLVGMRKTYGFLRTEAAAVDGANLTKHASTGHFFWPIERQVFLPGTRVIGVARD